MAVIIGVLAIVLLVVVVVGFVLDGNFPPSAGKRHGR